MYKTLIFSTGLHNETQTAFHLKIYIFRKWHLYYSKFCFKDACIFTNILLEFYSSLSLFHLPHKFFWQISFYLLRGPSDKLAPPPTISPLHTIRMGWNEPHKSEFIKSSLLMVNLKNCKFRHFFRTNFSTPTSHKPSFPFSQTVWF